MSQSNKKCSKCSAVKPVGEFYRSGKSKDGLLARCKPCHNAAGREYYRKNRDKVIARTNAYQAANPERSRGYWRKYYASHREQRAEESRQYRARNPEKVSAYQKDYRKRHPEKAARDQHARRAMLAGVPHDKAVTLEALRERDGDFCCFCGIQMDFCGPDTYARNKATLEHITPVSSGGSHTFCNTALTCRGCNLSKARFQFVWEWVP